MAVPLRPTAIRAGGDPGAVPTVSTYREYRPLPAVAQAVVCTWHGVAGWSRRLRVLPDGCLDLVWDDDRARIAGPTPGPARHPIRADAHTVGIRIRPGWAAVVLGLPLCDLCQVTDLADLWPPEAVRRLESRLACAPTAAARRVVLTRLVARRLVATRPDAGVLAALELLDHASTSIEEVAGNVGLSTRQLRRRFDDHVGLAPKTVQTILRFQRFRTQTAQPAATITLARAAAEFGYTDQSHLTRDCRRLAGTTPKPLIETTASCERPTRAGRSAGSDPRRRLASG